MILVFERRIRTMEIQKGQLISRRHLAKLLAIHPDSLSRMLREGPGCAIVMHGGPGREMLLSGWHADRWHKAQTCRRGNDERPCPACRIVLEDCVAIAEHLVVTGHGVGGCEYCDVRWGLCMPCSRFGSEPPPRFAQARIVRHRRRSA